MTIARTFSVLSLALAASLPMMLPVAAQTARIPMPSQASITSFGVEQVDRLWPGTVLAFSLDGTPGASVTLRIDGGADSVPMKEVRAGHYEGKYTVRQQDRLTAASLVTARTVKYGQMTSARLSRSLVAGAPDPAPLVMPQITGYTVTAPDRIRPGDELRFTMSGTPGGRARVVVQGITDSIALSEVRPGVYEGGHVMRRDDKLRGTLVADGYLVNDQRETRQRFEKQSAGGWNQQAVATCANCGSIEAVNQVEVKGDSPNVIGTIAGGLLGGVLGHQVGGGTGKDLATVIGAIGGAYAGNRVENSRDKRTVYRITVRLDGGGTQDFDYADDPSVTVGTRVKVENGALIRL
jgi:outer membrane lipoprotein SlyB